MIVFCLDSGLHFDPISAKANCFVYTTYFDYV